MTVGVQIYEQILKNPGITASELAVYLEKKPQHIISELVVLENRKKIVIDRTNRPYKCYLTDRQLWSSETEEKEEIKNVSKYVEEFDHIIKEVTKAAGRAVDSNYEIIDRGQPHKPGKLKRGNMGIYTFLYEDEFLKIGKAGENSNARFESQHYLPQSSNSNLSKSILSDKDMQDFGITKSNVGDWIKNNTRKIDILIDASLGIFTLDLIEAALHYRYEPRYEGFKTQRK